MIPIDPKAEDLPPELSPEYDEYTDLVIEFAEGRLSPEREAEVRERMRTDDGFRRMAEALVDARQHPAVISEAELDRVMARLHRRLAVHMALGLASASASERRSAAPAEPAPAPAPYEYPRPGSVPGRASAPHRIREAVVGYVYRRPVPAIAAAVAALAITVAGAWQIHNRVFDYSITTAPNVASMVLLPDSTRAELQPGSLLRYPRDNGRYVRRRVHLEGVGRFAVTPGGERFELWTTAAVISAEDARFAVRVLPDRTEIAVEAGEVWVTPLDPAGRPSFNRGNTPSGPTQLPGVEVPAPYKVQVRAPRANEPLDDGASTGQRITPDDSMKPVPAMVPIVPIPSAGGRP